MCTISEVSISGEGDIAGPGDFSSSKLQCSLFSLFTADNVASDTEICDKGIYVALFFSQDDG